MKPIYVVRLAPTAGSDAPRALKALLKRLGRQDGLRCVGLRIEGEETDAPPARERSDSGGSGDEQEGVSDES